MGKAAVGLVEGYWPENVFRYVAVPWWGLETELVEEPAKKWADQPALAAGDTAVTYKQLYEETERIAGPLQKQVQPGSKIALCIQSPVRAITAFLGALASGYPAHLMDPGTPPAQTRRLWADFKADAILSDEATAERARALSPGAPVVLYEQLLSGDAQKQPSNIDKEAALIPLAGTGGDLSFHSHHSLLAGALSWSSFSAIEPGQPILCCRPAHTWDALYWVMATLFKGSLCVFADLGDPSLTALIQHYHPKYAAVDLEGLERAAADARVAKALGDAVSGVFVPVEGPFSPSWRRRLRNRLGTEVFTVLGSARLGAVLASHPSWYEDGAVGIPVTNVDLWPLDPSSKKALDVAWESVEYAEIGVKSPMIAPPVAGSGDQWVPTGLIATMDPNGFYYLLQRPAQWMQRLGWAIPLLDRRWRPRRPPEGQEPKGGVS